MDDSNTIDIPISKSKLTLMLLGGLIFIGSGIGFIVNPEHFRSIIMRNTAIIFTAGLLSILFFGVIGFFILKKISDKSQGLIISDEGITDNSSEVSAGFIPWTDIPPPWVFRFNLDLLVPVSRCLRPVSRPTDMN